MKLYPQIKIDFTFDYTNNLCNETDIDIRINAKEYACIFKGRKWYFDSHIGGWIYVSWDPKILKPFKNKNVVVLKAKKITSWWMNLKKKSETENADEKVVEKLMKSTESNEDLFIIAEMSTLVLKPKIEEVDRYI